jgi:hypothetical protein
MLCIDKSEEGGGEGEEEKHQ